MPADSAVAATQPETNFSARHAKSTTNFALAQYLGTASGFGTCSRQPGIHERAGPEIVDAEFITTDIEAYTFAKTE